MSADELRRAAATLRERAEAATPGPWGDVPGAWGLPSEGPDHMRVVRAPHANATDAIARLEYERQGGDDAAYIATMHPGVGLALADWLDDEALMIETSRRVTNTAALEVARLINGGAS